MLLGQLFNRVIFIYIYIYIYIYIKFPGPSRVLVSEVFFFYIERENLCNVMG